MKNKKILTLNTIAEFHEIGGLPKPEHPLISVFDYTDVTYQTDEKSITWLQHFYCIGLKRDLSGKFRYGQQQYDFDSGIASMVSPGQIVEIKVPAKNEEKPTGIIMCLHPDFLWNTSLARKIKDYEFFGYAVNEALFVSEKEEEIILNIFKNIQREYHSNIDDFTQNIIVSQIEVMLNYFERFYKRQFITRKKGNHQILERFEDEIETYFNSGKLLENGLPTAQEIAESLNMSPNYLGSLLKSLTGQSTQQHIHQKLIDKAKERLSTTQLSVSEIAFEMGFEHPQSFSKLFKSKTSQTPLEFRTSFN
ncbi:response regulator transcription factor [Chryseobacterium sp. Leaf394]|uniref:helix-turn-helix domain-containing protein n=1 Tax=Chryseobacterium sp. Leaf394 TaxID=1736361 RepID=UPI0006F327EF|nr:response regulator transcription factor [Chryseobacterium sp. Leaf394]KQS92617.1 AraC family transcriptional regulator [Chryseobacterium sp. Leaf394]